jgi:ribosomal protein S19E (S16A)
MKWTPATADIFECVREVGRIAAEKLEASYSANANTCDRLRAEAGALNSMCRRALDQLEKL